jgi:hypothetical protein
LEGVDLIQLAKNMFLYSSVVVTRMPLLTFFAAETGAS